MPFISDEVLDLTDIRMSEVDSDKFMRIMMAARRATRSGSYRTACGRHD